MSANRLLRKLLPCLIAAWMLFMISSGCTPATKYVQPPLGESGVLKTPLLDRPELEAFTPEESKAIPRTAHGKILRCLAGWWGYADVADAANQAHEEYERGIFGGKEKATEVPVPAPAKKGWQFWK